MKPGDPPVLFPCPEGEISAKAKLLESLPESKRWDPVPGSEKYQAPENADEDEYAEGRGQAKQLVDDGLADAKREQVIQPARAAKKSK